MRVSPRKNLLRKAVNAAGLEVQYGENQGTEGLESKKVISEPVQKVAKEEKSQKREALGTGDMNPRIASVAEKLI